MGGIYPSLGLHCCLLGSVLAGTLKLGARARNRTQVLLSGTQASPPPAPGACLPSLWPLCLYSYNSSTVLHIPIPSPSGPTQAYSVRFPTSCTSYLGLFSYLGHRPVPSRVSLAQALLCSCIPVASRGAALGSPLLQGTPSLHPSAWRGEGQHTGCFQQPCDGTVCRQARPVGGQLWGQPAPMPSQGPVPGMSSLMMPLAGRCVL